MYGAVEAQDGRSSFQELQEEKHPRSLRDVFLTANASRKVMYSSFTVLAATVALLSAPASATDNGLAITPQMGWDNWNAFACEVSETLLLQTADLIVNYGLRDLGYYYVILDDCWSVGRNASNNNSLVADPSKFPNGMAAVADSLHHLDLGFGMYSDAGKYTCGQYAGSLGYETVDANTWASWGVDYLKYGRDWTLVHMKVMLK